jgi:hypothetical protein
MVQRIFKLLAALSIFAMIVGCSALLATMYATRQISGAIRQSMTAVEAEQPQIEQPVTLSFYQAAGIDEAELHHWFQELEANRQMQQVRVIFTLHNTAGHCLVNIPVALQWKDGIDWCQIDSSGVAEFAMSAPQLKNLTIIVPAGYTQLKQRTFPMGTRYEKPAQLSNVAGVRQVINDDAVQQDLLRHLVKARRPETVFKRLGADNTMRRSDCDVVVESASNDRRSTHPDEAPKVTLDTSKL